MQTHLLTKSNVGQNLRLEHPLRHADGIRAIQQTLTFRDPHLLENVERVQKRSSNDASFMAENRVIDTGTAQNNICPLKDSWAPQIF